MGDSALPGRNTGSATRPPRIALAGSAGVGKTTLGRRLGARHGVPFIPEGMRRHIENGLDMHTLSPAEHRRLMLELFDEMMDGVREAKAGAGGYVCDRSPVDFAAFWLYYGFGDDEAATAAFFDRVRETLRGLDAVILLPWGRIALESDGVRSPNPWLQLHFQGLIEGLLNYLPPARLLRLPDDVIALDDRTAWVETELGLVPSVGGRRDDP